MIAKRKFSHFGRVFRTGYFAIAALILLLQPQASPLYAETTDNLKRKFNTPVEAIEYSGDFASELGTLKVINRNPWHVQVSPFVGKGEKKDVIDEMVKKAIITNIYYSLIFTSLDKITITSVPLILDLGTQRNYLKLYSRTVSVTRAKATKVAQNIVGAGTLEELLIPDKDEPSILLWSPSFNKAIELGEKSSGLNQFYTEISS